MSATALTLPSEQVIWRPKVNPWAIIATICRSLRLSRFWTRVLPTLPLPYIAGSKDPTTGNDSTWVLTSYLAANAIVLPISGWLAEMIGRKRYFMLSLSIFTVSSLLCEALLFRPPSDCCFFRAVQGIGGGGAATDGTSHSQRYVSSRAARVRRLPSMALLRFSPPLSDLCSRRLDYGQLPLALDIFHHPAAGAPHPLFGEPTSWSKIRRSSAA